MILLVLIGIPVGIPVLASLFSVLLSFVVLIFGIALGAGGAALGLLVGGASTLAVGIVRMFRVPGPGICLQRDRMPACRSGSDLFVDLHSPGKRSAASPLEGKHFSLQKAFPTF